MSYCAPQAVADPSWMAQLTTFFLLRLLFVISLLPTPLVSSSPPDHFRCCSPGPPSRPSNLSPLPILRYRPVLPLLLVCARQFSLPLMCAYCACTALCCSQSSNTWTALLVSCSSSLIGALFIVRHLLHLLPSIRRKSPGSFFRDSS